MPQCLMWSGLCNFFFLYAIDDKHKPCHLSELYFHIVQALKMSCLSGFLMCLKSAEAHVNWCSGLAKLLAQVPPGAITFSSRATET